MTLVQSNRHFFTPNEDKKLKELKSSSQRFTWIEIAQQIGGVTPRQCRDRWSNYLDPSITNSPWTPQEDFQLIQQYQRYGPKWSQISKTFSCRSENNVKNRFYTRIVPNYHNLNHFSSKFSGFQLTQKELKSFLNPRPHRKSYVKTSSQNSDLSGFSNELGEDFINTNTNPINMTSQINTSITNPPNISQNSQDPFLLNDKNETESSDLLQFSDIFPVFPSIDESKDSCSNIFVL